MGAGLGPARLHGQSRSRRRGAGRHEPRQGVGGGRRQDVPRQRPNRREGAGRGRPGRTTANQGSKQTTLSSRRDHRQGTADRRPRQTRSHGRTGKPRSLASCRAGCWCSVVDRRACELGQAFVRFGVATTICQSGPRLLPTDHPRNAEALTAAIARDGVTVRTGARAARARAGAEQDGAHVVELDDGTTVEGHVILLAVGRDLGLEDLGLEHYGLDPSRRDGRPARRPAARRGRAVDGRRRGRPGAAHPPGSLPGRARRPDGARRSDRARLPRPPPRDVHGSRGGARSG